MKLVQSVYKIYINKNRDTALRLTSRKEAEELIKSFGADRAQLEIVQLGKGKQSGAAQYSPNYIIKFGDNYIQYYKVEFTTCIVDENDLQHPDLIDKLQGD